MADELTLEAIDKLIKAMKPYVKPKCEICGEPADYLFTYFMVCEGCIRTGVAESKFKGYADKFKKDMAALMEASKGDSIAPWYGIPVIVPEDGEGTQASESEEAI